MEKETCQHKVCITNDNTASDDRAAACGIAIIKLIGDIAGYAAPRMVGIVRDSTGGYAVPIMVASVFMFAACVCIALAPAMAARLETRVRAAE